MPTRNPLSISWWIYNRNCKQEKVLATNDGKDFQSKTDGTDYELLNRK